MGLLGVHNFYAGHTKQGFIMLFITLALGWLGVPMIIVWIWIIHDIIVVKKDANGVPFK